MLEKRSGRRAGSSPPEASSKLEKSQRRDLASLASLQAVVVIRERKMRHDASAFCTAKQVSAAHYTPPHVRLSVGYFL
jgi:hypothetical protein